MNLWRYEVRMMLRSRVAAAALQAAIPSAGTGWMHGRGIAPARRRRQASPPARLQPGRRLGASGTACMDQAHLFAIGILLAWLAGIRVYLTVFGVGLAGMLGWMQLPEALQPAQSPWVLGEEGAPASAPPFAEPSAPAATPVAAATDDLRGAVNAYEKTLLEEALGRHRFNQRATAAALGLSYDQLRHAMKRHKLQDSAP